MRDFSTTIAALSPEKRALLAARLKKKSAEFNSFPLSYAQQRLWLLYQLEPESAAYNIPAVVRLSGPLKVDALQRSLDHIVQRHEVLRTTFATVNGNPMQIVAGRATVTLAQVDLREHPANEREERARQLIVAESQQPFDLARGPLLRATLYRLDQQDYFLLLAMHHIISDGWSINVLIREVVALYHAFCNGKSLAPLPPLPIQYADFASWQRQWLQGEVLEKQLSYWKQQLAGSPPILELPTDRPRPALQTNRGAHLAVKLPASLHEALRTLSQREGVTHFMTLLAAFKALLYRYTGQTDFCVGTPIANRNRAETEGLIGFFVNTLVLRTDLSGDPSFRELLRRVWEVSLGAYAHQDLPFEMLVEQLQPQRDLSHTPLFQVMFVHQNAMVQPATTVDGVTLTPVEFENGLSTFDLTFSTSESSAGLITAVEYNTDLFDAGTMKRLLEHYRILLEGIIANPEARLSALPLLAETEQRQILVEWNSTKTAFPLQTIPSLFEAQVARTPEAIAVVQGNQQLTYRELDERANQLAHYLRKLGVGPEVLVGISMRRSLEMMVGLLGILKAGGAYLPLDPNYPEERLAFMLADSNAAVLLTQQSLLKQLPAHDARVLCLDTEWKRIAAESAERIASNVQPENLAYVIYTSGSTGKPKGVLVTHQAVVNHNLAVIKAFRLQPADRVLQFASINFDAAVEEIFPTWLCGATLVLRNTEVLLSGTELLQMIAQEQLTVLDLPTAYWHEWVAELEQTGARIPPPLRLVIAGGDKASADRLRSWYEHAGNDFTWVNTYGPTETTIISTLYEPSPEEKNARSWSEIPIGSPIANTQIYILDAHQRPVPIGVPGELHIGGAGVARGYLHRPDLTAEKFIPDPFSPEPGSRLYKSGDLARHLPDGKIEFIGRADHQIKIRGFRVELGEIEAVLNQHPSLRKAAVVAQDSALGEKRLVAYCEPQPHDGALSANDLRDFLKAQLPEYMIPAAFVMLEKLPLTAGGKIDRKALPATNGAKLDAGREYVVPRSQTEELLAGIWQQLLGLEAVGVYDNFFDLGGHSLLATQLISRLRDTFEVELPLRAVFEAPTVADLAKWIVRAKMEVQGWSAPPIRPIPRDGAELPLSFAQQRLWFLDQLEPGSAVYNIPSAVHLRGPLNVAVLEQSLNEIIRRHEILRTTIRTVDGRPQQVIAGTLVFSLPVVDLRALNEIERETEVQRRLLAEAQQPFDLSRGPLLRAGLLQLGEEEHVMVLTMHHIVADGWSTNVFVQEIAALYDAFSNARPSPLPPLPIQYADFAGWQRQWLQGEVLEKQLSYWKQQLGAGSPPILELPTDRPRPAVQTNRGDHYAITLPHELLQAIRKLSRQEGVTNFMTLLAAFQTLLYHYTGQEDICAGTPIANRNRAEIENLIGFFVNTLVLRTDLSGDPTFRQLLRRVREVALGAYAHQDVPFEMLVDAVQPQRDLSHTPLFQVMFVHQNAPRQTSATLPNLTLRPLEVENKLSMFDLTLITEEAPDGLHVALEYNTDLFDTGTIARMLEHFRILLEGVVAHPETRLSDLPLLSEIEQHKILVEWNNTKTDFPQQTLSQLFETQVERTPEAIAVVQENRQLTYRELNNRANQLAQALRKLGVGPEVLVGLSVERSPEMVIGLLGILKAGGAYVPLDPLYPKDRLAFICDDAQIRVLLTQRALAPNLPDHRAQVICLDSPAWAGQIGAAESPANLPCPAHLDNTAYVIYTSGSTGKPKGVLVTHRSVINHNFAVIKAFQLQPTDRVLQFASINFDAAVEEIFPTWFAGATLVLRRAERLASIPEFCQLIEQEQLTVVDLPTAYWHEWVSELMQSKSAIAPSLRLVIAGGDKASAERLASWQELVGEKIRWLNTYGPTEGTIISTLYAAPSAEELAVPPGRDDVPIGYPIANTQIYILNKHLRPVPEGVAGELYIGGAGVARGYLHRPELTAEKFIPDPFSQEPGARLYKTGDLARYCRDGNIEFIGRADNQVKIRGFRVELEEIEEVLRQHPALRQVAVVAREDSPGAKRLVAYCVPETGNEALTVSELRNFVKAQLPEYMIPAAYVMIETLPMTPSGKVDRKALPAPEQNRTELGAAYVAPRTPVEEKLVEIWQQVLGVKQVGVNDNFFELGGDSILSIQVIARAKQAGVGLTPKQLFQYPTIAGLAAVAGKAETIHAEQGLVTGPVPLTPIQHWFFAQQFHSPQHWNQSILLEVRQPLDSGLLEQVVNHLVRHHDALRLRFHQTDAGWQQINAEEEASIPFSRIDLSTLAPEEQRTTIESTAAELQASLNLSAGPLLRVAYFDLGAKRNGRLLIVIHHLAVDGVSWRILMEDVQTAYQQLRRGEAVQLPPKTTSFQYWSQRLADYAQSAELQQEVDYWLGLMRHEIATIPVDFSGGDNNEAEAAEISVALNVEETAVLLHEIPSAYRTQINEILLTALVKAFGRWTGSRALLVELEGHGREDIFPEVDLSRTVGWFTTVFPALLDAGNATSPGAALKTIKEQMRRVPKHGLGFGVLRYLAPETVRERLQSRLQPEISFNYLGQFDQAQPADGPFMPAVESRGPERHPAGHRTHVLDITGIVSGGQLRLAWSYSKNRHRQETIMWLAQVYLEELRGLIAHCCTPEAAGYTPSDFPMAKLDQKKLDKVLEKLNQSQRNKFRSSKVPAV